MDRNLGDPVVSSAIPGWSTGLPTPGLDGALDRRGANLRVPPRYCQTKETKCGEMAVGCRSALIVPSKLGNSPRRTQWRKAKRRPQRDLWMPSEACQGDDRA